MRHFLSLHDLDATELAGLMARAGELKRMLAEGERHDFLPGRVVGMVFEKSSTRTRVSFEAGMAHFGGHVIFLSPRDIEFGKREPVEDTARILSRMVDAVVLRTFAHETVERFARHSDVPVINALTDRHHPCQLLADIQTYIEHRGPIEGRRVAWVGDGNNVCNGFIQAAERFSFDLVVACPAGYEPGPEMVAEGGGRVTITADPREAARGADLIVTDVWTSMGQEEERERRRVALAPFQVNRDLVALAAPDAIVMHCLPAHRGEEITADVLEGPQSVVWDEAENRMHAQKALLEFLLLGAGGDG